MSPEDKRTYLQYLFAAAWADGEIVDSERDILSTLVATTEMTAELEAEVRAWFEEPPPSPDWERPQNDPQLRQMLLRQVTTLAGADFVFNEEELQYLDRLRRRLGVPDSEYHQIQMEVEKALARDSD